MSRAKERKLWMVRLVLAAAALALLVVPGRVRAFQCDGAQNQFKDHVMWWWDNHGHQHFEEPDPTNPPWEYEFSLGTVVDDPHEFQSGDILSDDHDKCAP